MTDPVASVTPGGVVPATAAPGAEGVPESGQKAMDKGATSPRVAATEPVSGKGRRSRLVRAEARVAWLLLVPCLIGLALFFVYPLVTNVYYSLTNYDLVSTASFVGLDNYRFMFSQDPQLWQAVTNTLWFTVISVPLQVAYSIALAVVITSVRRGSNWYRTLFYLPALLPPVAATMGFTFLFNPGSGLLNRILGALGLPQPMWLYDTGTAKWVFIIMMLWGAGNTIVVMIAGVLDVPRQLHEAAEIDGAGAWRRFRYVTLPTLRPVILFATVTGLIAALQLFTQPYVANQLIASANSFVVGVPEGSTMFYTTWLYQQAFSFFRVGYASALATMLFVVALSFTVLVLKVGRFTEESNQ